MRFSTVGKALNFRANTDKYGHLATLVEAKKDV